MPITLRKTLPKNNLTRLIPLVVAITILLLVSGLFYYRQKSIKKHWVKVEVWGSGGEWWWRTGSGPYWIANEIKPGDVELSASGIKIAEVIDIKKYPEGQDKGYALTANLLALINPKTKTITFRDQEIRVGNVLTLRPAGKIITGNISYIEGQSVQGNPESLIVTGKLYNIHPWEADALLVGDKAIDGSGLVIAEVISKQVDLANMVVTTDRGEVLLRKDPIKREVTIGIRLLAKKYENIYYYANNQPVIISRDILLVFNKYQPVVKIVDFRTE